VPDTVGSFAIVLSTRDKSTALTMAKEIATPRLVGARNDKKGRARNDTPSVFARSPDESGRRSNSDHSATIIASFHNSCVTNLSELDHYFPI
jgi:hypothetical protein